MSVKVFQRSLMLDTPAEVEVITTESPLHPYAKILVDNKFEKILFGCFNLCSFTEFTLPKETDTEMDAEITEPRKHLSVVAQELKNTLANCPLYGDQNYGAEIFLKTSDVTSIVCVGRTTKTIISEEIEILQRNLGIDEDIPSSTVVSYESEFYPYAKFLLDSGCEKILFGCFNLGSFKEFVIKRNQRNLQVSKNQRSKLAKDLKNILETCPMFGDQNYGAELFVNSDDAKRILSVGRMATVIEQSY
jgi:hypothetical protein